MRRYPLLDSSLDCLYSFAKLYNAAKPKVRAELWRLAMHDKAFACIAIRARHNMTNEAPYIPTAQLWQAQLNTEQGSPLWQCLEEAQSTLDQAVRFKAWQSYIASNASNEGKPC